MLSVFTLENLNVRLQIFVLQVHTSYSTSSHIKSTSSSILQGIYLQRVAELPSTISAEGLTDTQEVFEHLEENMYRNMTEVN